MDNNDETTCYHNDGRRAPQVIAVTMLSAVMAALSGAEAGVIAYHAPAILPATTVYAAPAVPAAAALVRTPSLDSAVVHSERVGGNFAYSTVEGHAYTALAPVVHHAPAPVAVAYRASPVVAAQPLPVVHAAHAPVVYAAAVPAKAVFYAHWSLTSDFSTLPRLIPVLCPPPSRRPLRIPIRITATGGTEPNSPAKRFRV